MNQEQLLEAILDKTAHVRGGIDAQDMNIVHNALDERDKLIAMYAQKKFGPARGKCAELAARVKEQDDKNTKSLQALMDDCGEKLFEARRKIKELETGKKATVQYHGATGAGRGRVFDFKQ